MVIGLDYDDTYTRDPDFWDDFVLRATDNGSSVYIVTWRDDEEAAMMIFPTEVRDRLAGIYPTNRKAKQKFMFDHGICIDVWIDDNPFAILNSMVPYTASTWE